MAENLIFDIGANNGDDSAFYLAKGFRVVALEADPVLANLLVQRFADQIASGDLIVENVGVADAEGTLDFFVNSHKEWSSFVKDGKATKQNTYETITIKTIPMAQLLERHGTPYYLKIDIEGFEKQAIGTLRSDMDLPAYLSFEINYDWREITDTLAALGYSSFTVVRQGRDVHPDMPNPAREGIYVAQKFLSSMSGSFGRDVTGTWVSSTDLDAVVAREKSAAQEVQKRGGSPVWHDIHCRMAPPD